MANTETKNYRIATGFGKNSDNDIVSLSLDVEDGLLNNPAFLNLPVKLTDVATQRLALVAAMTEARKGGTDRTRLKAAAKQLLVDMLFKLAHYCQGEAHHDLDALLSTGFEVVSVNHTPGPLDRPTIMGVLNNTPGLLVVRGHAVLNGRNYQVRSSTDGGKTWTLWPAFNGARQMVLQPTLAGTTYLIQFCALGGSTGQSPWSNPVSIMST